MPRVVQSNKDENTLQLGRKRHSGRALQPKETALRSRVPLRAVENQPISPVSGPKPHEPTQIKHENVFSTIHSDPRFEPFSKTDVSDPFQYGSYSRLVFQYLGDLENYSATPGRFLERRGDITTSMRAVLVNWLVQVHLRFNLVQETLFICVQLLDRYISHAHVARAELQLVGVTCLLLAAKYEEQVVPEITDFVHVTDYSVSVGDIRETERSVLLALDHDLSPPVALQFLRRLTKTCQVTQVVHNLSKYFLELCLYDAFASEVKPSRVAAACVCLAAVALGHNHWQECVEVVSGYDYNNIIMMMRRIPAIVRQNKELGLSAVSNKYSLANFGRVSELPLFNSEQFLSFTYFDNQSQFPS